MIIIIIILLMAFCTIIALPLGIIKGINDAKAKQADILFKKQVLRNMEIQNKKSNAAREEIK